MISHQIVNCLKNGAILLTPTRRLASGVMKSFDSLSEADCKKEAMTKSIQTWETPTILSLKDWSLQFWQTIEISGIEQRYLLSSHESLLLMESIIQHSRYAAQLLRPHTTAKLVLSAWQILHAWRQTHQLKDFNENIDQEALQFFCQQYTDYLQKNKLLDEAEWLDVLSDFFENEEKSRLITFERKHLIYYGFDDITPQFDYFLQVLQKAEWVVEAVEPPLETPITAHLLPCQDLQSEILQAAGWAKNILSQHDSKNPMPNIGIVLPNLPEHRDRIINIFESVFEPAADCEPEAKINPHYNLSTAIPLLQYPVIQSCFSIFKLLKQEFYVSEIISILNSPYINGSITYYDGYQAIKSKIMTCFKDTLTLNKLIQTLKDDNKLSERSGQLLDVLQTLTQRFQMNHTRKFSEWRIVFQELLSLFDWPGERKLNSIEYQAVNRFYTFLDEFTQLDVVFQPQSYYKALDKLQKYASNIAFQPENQGTPIQILGILEASGLQFDYLWLMQLYHENWPPKSEPNPFIPVALQKQTLMPHASPLREYEFAKKLTDRLLASAEHILCSYPMIHDNNPVFPSELVNHLLLMPENSRDSLQSIDESVLPEQTEQLIEYYDDFDDQPLEDFKLTGPVKGGSQLFAYQAQCPFKAFAKIRMNANNPDQLTIGIDAKLRGTLLHECLHNFWTKIQSQEMLIKMNHIELEIEHIVKRVVQKYKTRSTMTDALWDIEAIRLQQLLIECIEIEKKRPPFHVAALEEIKTVTIDGLSINVRIDRIDRLTGNQYLLIDYKTGQVNLNELINLPLKSPQLPLYLSVDFSFIPHAAAWFVIHNEKSEYIGVSNVSLDIDSVKVVADLAEHLDWNALLLQWRVELNRMARDFIKGRLQVQPLNSAQTCRLCDLQTFCRVEDKIEVEKRYG